jgi:hypothetical protein
MDNGKESINSLPKNWSLCAQYRLYNGRRLGPYWFRFWRENGVLRKEYIPQEQVPIVRAALRLTQFERSRSRAMAGKSWQAIREGREAVRGI